MVSNNFMEIRRGGGGVFERGNPWGGGTKAVSEIRVEGGGDQKTVPSVGGRGYVWIVSGIIH